MNGAGLVSGTPTLDGIFDVTVRLIDGAGLSRQQLECFEVRVPLGVATSFLQLSVHYITPYVPTL